MAQFRTVIDAYAGVPKVRDPHSNVDGRLTMSSRVDAVIVGAGIAGIATAWQLAERLGTTNAILVDPRPPLSLTSNRPEANYRSWWPQRPMVELAERSITLMRGLLSDGAFFAMNDRGYLYVTLDEATADDLPNVRARYAAAGQGSDAADLLDAAATRARYRYLTSSVQGAVHARHAGSLDTVALGMAMLERAQARGVRVVRGEIIAIERRGGAVTGVGARFQTADGEQQVETSRVINAAGPFAADVAALAHVVLPLETVLRQKVLLRDTRGVVPRDAPFTIGVDATGGLPSGVHVKPDDSVVPDGIKLGWARDQEPSLPIAEPACPPEFAREVLIRAGTLIPGLLDYLEGDLPVAAHDGGFYARTPDGLPLIGATSIEGFVVIAGLAGFGAMMACAAGEFAAKVALDGDPAGDPRAERPFDPMRPQPSPDEAKRAAGPRPGEL
ncbi:MAG: FAD-binding oxidoreductase [Chloroflexota bacterium]